MSPSFRARFDTSLPTDIPLPREDPFQVHELYPDTLYIQASASSDPPDPVAHTTASDVGSGSSDTVVPRGATGSNPTPAVVAALTATSGNGVQPPVTPVQSAAAPQPTPLPVSTWHELVDE